jgi:hypothetical protein
MHSKMYQSMAKWRICNYDEERDLWQIRAVNCDPCHSDRSRPCAWCIQVQIDVQAKHHSVMNAAKTSNYHSRNWRMLSEALRHEQEARHSLNFQASTFYLVFVLLAHFICSLSR